MGSGQLGWLWPLEVTLARFTVLLYREEGEHSAVVPVLNVATQGRTGEEVLARAHEAIQLQVKSLAEHDEPIPGQEEPPIVAAVTVDIPAVAPTT